MQPSAPKKMDPLSLRRQAGSAAELLSVLAHPNRLMVMCHLLDGEMSVRLLAEAVGMSQSALSQQLARLRAMDLVATRRQGRTIHYRLASPEVARILATLHDIFCGDGVAAGRAAARPGIGMPADT
jgi:DNA-binding transcriptional ArsR family regulator